MILDGKALAREVRSRVKEKSLLFAERAGRRPLLRVVLVGEDPASIVYVRNKKSACDEAGIDCLDTILPGNVDTNAVATLVDDLNCDDKVDGILVQMPLPPQIDAARITEMIDPAKDVDGFTPWNVGLLSTGRASLLPCTPRGILTLLKHYSIETRGRNICVVGRSSIVGRPLANLLLASTDATVDVCNSHTRDLKAHVLQADIVVSAAGCPGLIRADMVREGTVVVDVGINRIPDPSRKSGYRLVGDCDFEALKGKAAAITPVPGGIGPMTVASLVENVLIAASIRAGVDIGAL